MEYLEESPDFMNLEEESGEDAFVATCHECGDGFIIMGDEEPKSCPNCDVKFIQG